VQKEDYRDRAKVSPRITLVLQCKARRLVAVPILVHDQKIRAQAFGYRPFRTFAEWSLGQFLLLGENFLHPSEGRQPTTLGGRTGKFDRHVERAKMFLATRGDLLPLYQDKAVTPTSLKDIFTPIWAEPIQPPDGEYFITSDRGVAWLADGYADCQTQSYLRIGQRYLRMTQNPL